MHQCSSTDLLGTHFPLCLNLLAPPMYVLLCVFLTLESNFNTRGFATKNSQSLYGALFLFMLWPAVVLMTGWGALGLSLINQGHKFC